MSILWFKFKNKNINIEPKKTPQIIKKIAIRSSEIKKFKKTEAPKGLYSDSKHNLKILKTPKQIPKKTTIMNTQIKLKKQNSPKITYYDSIYNIKNPKNKNCIILYI